MTSRRWLARAFAIVGFSCLGDAAQAAVVNFESKSAFSCVPASSDNADGMQYAYGYYVCYYSPTNPADFPTAPPSTVMASGFSSTTFTLMGGGVFDLQSVDLAFGPFEHGGLLSDTTQVVGTLFGGGTLTANLTVDYTFDTYALNWSGLTSITFGELSGASQYLAFDNIVYDPVPEPTTFVLLGLGLARLALSRRRG